MPDDSSPGDRPPFTLDGFYERLVRWIAVDDQVRIHGIHS